jgi:hypothetical protein
VLCEERKVQLQLLSCWSFVKDSSWLPQVLVLVAALILLLRLLEVLLVQDCFMLLLVREVVFDKMMPPTSTSTESTELPDEGRIDDHLSSALLIGVSQVRTSSEPRTAIGWIATDGAWDRNVFNFLVVVVVPKQATFPCLLINTVT